MAKGITHCFATSIGTISNELRSGAVLTQVVARIKGGVNFRPEDSFF